MLHFRSIKCLLAIITFFIHNSSIAQDRYNTWLRTTLHTPLSKIINADIEWQHRRQNGLADGNPLQYNLMYSGRMWLNYQLSKQWKISLSPFAYLQNYEMVQEKGDEKATPRPEIRFSAAIANQTILTKRLFFKNRNAIEYRIFEQPHKNILRLRHKSGLHYQFSSEISLFLYDEVLFNVAGTPTTHIFDHNRFGLNLKYKPFEKLTLELGYLYISRLPSKSNNIRAEHNLLLYFTYDLMI